MIQGRKVQDKQVLKIQLAQERKKSANLRREVLAVDMTMAETGKIGPSNNRKMKLREERLNIRILITENSVKKF